MNWLDPNGSVIHLCRHVNFHPFFCSGRSLIHYSRGLKNFHFALDSRSFCHVGLDFPSKVLSSSVLNRFRSLDLLQEDSLRSQMLEVSSSKYLQRGNTWVRFWWTSQLRHLSWWLRYTKTRSKWPCIVFSWLSAGSFSLHTILLNLNMLSKVLQTQLLHMLYSKGPLASCQAVQPPRMIVLGWIRLSTQQTKNDILYSSC